MLKLCKTKETFFVYLVSILIFAALKMKNRILKKSEELFLSLGFKNVTMDDIASAIGISKKTIYTHFSNKTELVQSVTFSVLDFIHKNIERINKISVNPIEELYEIKMFVMDYLKNERGSAQFQLKKYYPNIFEQLEVKKFEKMLSSVENSLKKGIKLELFRSDIDITFISRVYLIGMSGIRETTVFPEYELKKEYLMESYLEYHLRAIVTQKGLNILKRHIKKQ